MGTGGMGACLAEGEGSDRPQRAISGFMMRPASDLAALQHGVDVTLSLTPLEAVLGHDLGYEIVLALERGQILFGELAPLRSDFFENHLPGLCVGLGIRSRLSRSCV